MLKKIKKMWSLLSLLSESVEEVKTNSDGALYVKLKSHLLLHSKGSSIFFSEDGYTLQMANIIDSNPSPDNARKLFEQYVKDVRPVQIEVSLFNNIKNYLKYGNPLLFKKELARLKESVMCTKESKTCKQTQHLLELLSKESSPLSIDTNCSEVSESYGNDIVCCSEEKNHPCGNKCGCKGETT